MPFNIVDKPLTREFANLKSISSKTLKNIMTKLTVYVKNRIKELLSNSRFAIMFDGWTAKDDHFIGVYAIVANYEKPSLISFTVFENQEDMSAEKTKELLEDVLATYGKNASDVVCLIGDNCACNLSTALKLNLPIVGCLSHRLNLAVNEKIVDSSWKDNNEAVHSLMVKLSTLKMRGWLNKCGTGKNEYYKVE